MRINSSVDTLSSVNTQTTNNNVTAQSSKQAETAFQGGAAMPTNRTSAMMRSSEMNIGAGLKADMLRNSTGNSLKSTNLVSSKGSATDRATTGTTLLQVTGTSTFRASVAKDLAAFAPGTTVDASGYVHAATSQQAGHSQGYTLINNLLNGGKKVTIAFQSQNASTASSTGSQDTPTRPGAGSTATVAYDPAWSNTIALPTLQKNGTIKDHTVSSSVVLAHELIHATHAQRGTINRSLVDHTFTENGVKLKETWRFEEFRTTGFPGQRQGNEPSENSIRAELGFQPRAAYLFRDSWSRV